MDTNNNIYQLKMTSGNIGMENLIFAINEVQDVCTKAGSGVQFDLPQIAVVGCQSAGKSSVLENFVGRDFLPRGAGVVTRVPLILQLINTPEGSEEYAQFLHVGKKFKNFDEVRTEIETETDRKVGTNKGIADDPINLRIYSPKVLNITLVDLPGLTKVPVGDVAQDIEQQITDMILKYISKENCLILAVTPANIDLANSDALKLASKVDKDSSRTIGVITKLDLMDEGTDAREILENRLFPLKHGYVGVVNRSNQDIKDKMNISDALLKESNFFKNHDYYRTIMDQLGIPHLQRVLNQQLTEHIRKTLPKLRNNLLKQIAEYETERDEFNKMHPENFQGMKYLVTMSIDKLKTDFKNGIGDLGSENIDISQPSSGVKINRIFFESLPFEFSEIDLAKNDSAKNQMLIEIETAISNMYGIRSFVSTPYMVFERFIRIQIEMLRQPITICIDMVIEELKMAIQSHTQCMSIHSRLCERIENEIMSCIISKAPLHKKQVQSLVDLHLAYVNTKHEDYLANINAIDAVNSIYHQTSLTGDAVKNIYHQIDSYMRIVKKTLCDMVPKAITLYIIKSLQDFINVELFETIYNAPESDYLEWFGISPEDKKFKSKIKMYEASKTALEIIRKHGLTERLLQEDSQSIDSNLSEH